MLGPPMAWATWRERARLRGWWAVAAIALAAAVGAALPACDLGTRFPVCRSSADCAGEGGGSSTGSSGAVCFNLRCVECRYDVDCPGGKTCNSLNECVILSSGGEPESDDAGAVKWDPGNWEDCAADCKDEACLKRCNERFQK